MTLHTELALPAWESGAIIHTFRSLQNATTDPLNGLLCTRQVHTETRDAS
jgi:hypothetical protein